MAYKQPISLKNPALKAQLTRPIHTIFITATSTSAADNSSSSSNNDDDNNNNNMDGVAVNIPPNVPIPVHSEYSGRNAKDMKALNTKPILAMSITQVVIGFLCFFLMVLKLTMDDYCYRSPCSIGYGIYSGVLYITSGTLGCCAAKIKANRCLVVAFMVMNIISASVSFTPLMFGIMDATIWNYNSNFRIAASSLISVFSVVEAVVAIVSSALCCRLLCRCCDNELDFPSYAYFDTKTQQFVFLSGRQVPPGYDQAARANNSDWTNNNSPPAQHNNNNNDYDDPLASSAGETPTFNYRPFK